ncbi:ABC transporter substrate-binding protein [Vibrio sp. HN007]|uniref:ABC transporter substrate-binding protein n=1 Tax=Vibrio iocasae TaxID=3098914 RepID=UPI0035D41ACC
MVKYFQLFLCLLFTSFVARADVIYVVESYHAEYLWDQSYKRGLEEVLGADHELVYFEMDTKRLPESMYQSRADKAWEMYISLNPSLVILADDNALKYLGRKFVNTATPVVYLGINANPRKYGVADAPNFSGVIERPLLLRSILMLKKIIPLKRMLLLFDSKETSKVLKEDFFYGNDSITLAGIHIDLKLIGSYKQWQSEVLEAKVAGYDAIVAGLYHTLTDEQGKHVNPEEVIEWTSINSPLPPFGFWDFSVGPTKNIGGYVIFGYEEGKLAGQLAIQMLEGKRNQARPMIGGQGQFMFSKSQLQKWGITLPPYIAQQSEYVE